jgi:hypothetical protein
VDLSEELFDIFEFSQRDQRVLCVLPLTALLILDALVAGSLVSDEILS